MVEISIDIKNKIQKYIEKLKNANFDIQEVYLFGSYSNGTENELSDIDLAIVSSDFKGNRLLDREKLLGFNKDIDYRLSVLPIDFESKENSLFYKQEVVEKGIRIY
jgi:predicted nucleotidyltransferase